DLRQLRFSQTAQQEADKRYTYVKYDPRGRITETGLVAGSPDISSIIASGLATNPDEARPKLDDKLHVLAIQTDFPDAASAPAYTREQVASTSYDHPANACDTFDAQNLRGRISALVAQSSLVTTCYSYDPHGNITSLLQRIPGLGDKRIDYDY